MKKKIILAIVTIAALLIAAVSCGKANTVEFTFDAGGGTPVAAVSVAEGTEYVLPSTEKAGYGFDGWYDNAGFSGNAYEKIVASENKTFYAKWTKLYTVSLDADGGTGVPTEVSVRLGANVYDAIKDYAPVKSGLIFGAWFDGERELGSNTRMTEQGLSLKAKYKVEYSVRIYEENLSDENYTEVESVKGAYYVGATYEPDVEKGKDGKYFLVGENSSSAVETGFVKTYKDGQSVQSLTLSADKAQNNYALYFDRQTYRIYFFGNYADAPSYSESGKFGQEINVPYNVFERDGYYLFGWAETADGEATYVTNYIDTLAYNVADKPALNENKIEITSVKNLYAVWSKAYTDMFGGGDYVYVTDAEEGVAYLCRGGVFFKGLYDDYTGEVSFSDENGIQILSCKVNSDYTFSYYDSSRSQIEYQLDKGGENIDKTTTVKFDEFNGISFNTNVGTSNEQRVKGVYEINEDGDYVASFEDGTERVIRIVKISLQDVQDLYVFRIRNEDDIKLGEIARCAIYSERDALNYYGQLVNYTYFGLKLSGFGTATVNEGTTESVYNYEKDGDFITLTDPETEDSIKLKIFPLRNGAYGYMDYFEELDAEFTSSDGVTVELDGTMNGTIREGGNSSQGYYSVRASAFGGFVVTVFTESGVRKFMISKTEVPSGVEVIGDEQQAETVYEYGLEEKDPAYAEYYIRHNYNGNLNTYVVPLLVMNDSEDDVVDFYGIKPNETTRQFVKIASGTLAAKEGKYLFEVSNIVSAASGISSPIFDVENVKSFVFSTETETGYDGYDYGLYYVVSAVNEEDETTYYSQRYVSGENYLILGNSGYMIVKYGNNEYHGSYTLSGNIVSLVTTVSGRTLRLVYETDGNAFTELEFMPYKAYALGKNETHDADTYIAFDGKGGAAYYEAGVKVCDGVVTKTGKTTTFEANADIYAFAGEGAGAESFEYLLLYSSSATYFAKYDENYAGRFTSEDGQLILDGFSYNGRFDGADGTSVSGRYYIDDNNVVVLRGDETRKYFDVSGDRFRMRGDEYGDYVLTDNQSRKGVYITLDGYETATVTTGDPSVTVEGDYVIAEDGTITVRYDVGSSNYTAVGKIGPLVFTEGGKVYREIAQLYGEVAMVYVNGKDWTILILKDNGEATLYKSGDNARRGTYALITDDTLYFKDYGDEEGTSLFYYDITTGKLGVPEERTARGYYTADLDSLVFTENSKVEIDGEFAFYYSTENIDATTQKITIYRKDPENANASRYGYVTEEFGTFSKEKEYGGKTYYANGGFAIRFLRDAADENEEAEGNYVYPVPLSETSKAALTELKFAPSGKTFSAIVGKALIGGREYDCYVYREEGDTPDELITYITVGYIRMEIEVRYGGTDDAGASLSSFSVKSMKREISVSSYNHIEGFYATYVRNGMAAAYEYLANNRYGTISIVIEYDEKGDATEDYVTARFGPLSGIFDLDGNPIEIEKAAYEYDNLYKVNEKIGDYEYNLYFRIVQHRRTRLYCYYVYAFSRVEKVYTSDKSYYVEAERYVASDTEFRRGAYLGVSLYEKTDEIDGEGNNVYRKVPLSYGFTSGDAVYYITRTYEQKEEENADGETVTVNGKILTSTYRTLKFTEEVNIVVDDNIVLRPFASVEVTIDEVEVYVSEDEKSYIEVPSDGKPLIVCVDGKVYYVSESEYFDEDKKYVLTISDGTTVTVTLGESGTATFGTAAE